MGDLNGCGGEIGDIRYTIVQTCAAYGRRRHDTGVGTAARIGKRGGQ